MEHEATIAGLELLPRDWKITKSNWETLRDDELTNSLTGVWWMLEYMPFSLKSLHVKLFLSCLPFQRYIPFSSKLAGSTKDYW